MPSSAETNDVVRRDAPVIVLEYGSPVAESRLPSILLATFCFGVAHLVAEFLTQYLAAFKFGWLGSASNPSQLDKLQDQFFFNMVTEVAWLLPAIALVFLVQLGVGLLWGGRSRSKRWAIGLAIGVCYCWAGWGFWGLSKSIGFPFPESTNFLSSMLLAAVGGTILATWRRAEPNAAMDRPRVERSGKLKVGRRGAGH